MNIDFEVVGQYPPPYFSNEVEKIGRLKPFNIDAEFDDAENTQAIMIIMKL